MMSPSILALALAYHAQGKYEEAAKAANKAITLASTAPDEPRRAFHEAAAEIGSIEFDRGNKIAGMKLFRGYVMRLSRSIDARLGAG